jgi:hypothetical protein
MLSDEIVIKAEINNFEKVFIITPFIIISPKIFKIKVL